MTVVTAAWFDLPGNGLPSRIHPPHVGTHGTPHTPGISRPITVHIPEVVQALGIESSCRCIRVG
jgi:hypothetical protein